MNHELMSEHSFWRCVVLIIIAWFIFEYMHQHKEVEYYTDPGTACEYLISPNGTLVPRIGHDFMQGGCDPQEDY